jgi:phosphatidylinositol glycan class T
LTISLPTDGKSFEQMGILEVGQQANGKNASLRMFGEPLLILLPVPDFSMPFNVICLVCTTIVIYYGNAVALSTKL